MGENGRENKTEIDDINKTGNQGNPMFIIDRLKQFSQEYHEEVCLKG